MRQDLSPHESSQRDGLSWADNGRRRSAAPAASTGRAPLRAAGYGTLDADGFLQATAQEAWLSVPELVAVLTRAGYWTGRGYPGGRQRAAHVRSQLTKLRDAEGQLLFASVDIRTDGGITPVYKQARLLRRGLR
jgi:hypothetical protein